MCVCVYFNRTHGFTFNIQFDKREFFFFFKLADEDNFYPVRLFPFFLNRRRGFLPKFIFDMRQIFFLFQT